jgi:hypothetical protein
LWQRQSGGFLLDEGPVDVKEAAAE